MHLIQHDRFQPAADLGDALLFATVRARCAAADLGTRLAPPEPPTDRRAIAVGPRLQDETGAQAAEYAMMSGVGVAIAAAAIAVIRRSDVVKTVVMALMEILVSFVQSWFSG